MIVAVSYAPVIEEILIEKLTKYLMEDIQWANQFPNYSTVRINNEYPWVPYMTNEESFTQGWLDLNKVSETLFPSVTIVSSQDVKSPQLFVDLQKTTLEKDEFAELEALVATDGYMVAPAAMTAIQTHFDTNNFLHGSTFIYQNRDTVSFDITTDDRTNIKNRLYDFCQLYLKAFGTMELMQEMNIHILENTVTGNRSGTYNIDFGRVLRGSSIQFSVDYVISQTFYNTDAGVITDIDIDHTVSVRSD